MGEGASDLVFRHARGLGEGMIKASTAVNELLMVADRDPSVLRAALEKAKAAAGHEAADNRESSDADSDAPGPQAPALLAVRLLEQALEELNAS